MEKVQGRHSAETEMPTPIEWLSHVILQAEETPNTAEYLRTPSNEPQHVDRKKDRMPERLPSDPGRHQGEYRPG